MLRDYCRLPEKKNVVYIYDYVDSEVPMLTRMYGKRLKGYQAIGYTVQEPAQAIL